MTTLDHSGRRIAVGQYVTYKEPGFGRGRLRYGLVLRVRDKSISVEDVNPYRRWAPTGKILAYKKPSSVETIGATEFKKLTRFYRN
jgi:hypothetical protein